MTDDATLLRDYAIDREQAAFAHLVERHLPLVYSAALRRLAGDAHRAHDVAQVVFCALARDARKLADHADLTGWLYTATRNAVVDVARSNGGAVANRRPT
jgi:RNA polymerase sigma factor (sigma-70 family)